MKAFTTLFFQLDSTTSTLQKVKALKQYFAATPARDAVWALSLLMGNRLKRLLTSRDLHNAARTLVDLPDWLYEEAYRHVGDSAELISLLVVGNESKQGEATGSNSENISLADWMEQRILPLRQLNSEERLETIKRWWQPLSRQEVFILNKLLTGGFRVGVSKTLVIRALAEWSGLSAAVLTHRLMGNWEASASFFEALLADETEAGGFNKPFPFCLAYPLEENAELRRQQAEDAAKTEFSAMALDLAMGPATDWQVEWKWDGIRCQLLRHEEAVSLWSRGEELISDQFPELLQAAKGLPKDVILDGEVLAYKEGAPLHFSVLQSRLGRKNPGAAIQQKAPVIFMAYDLLASQGQDLRETPLRQRRAALEALLRDYSHPLIMPSPLLEKENWQDLLTLRQESRERGVEGFMLKRQASAYGVGRKKGDWWKWKIEPFTIDAVLLYAQPGSGRRANLYTDYTFAVWDEEQDEKTLVPVAKAYSGLTDKEIRQVDSWIRRNTLERFGPVRSVKAELVFELAFEGISASKRHKSGIALRFPRMHRWRQDKTVAEADTLKALHQLL